MGFYINPSIESKEDFLERVGTPIAREDVNLDDAHNGLLPVVLVNNGPFTAAGIIYDERELREFTRDDDTRPRKYFLVEVNDLIVVAGANFVDYAEKHGLTKKR